MARKLDRLWREVHRMASKGWGRRDIATVCGLSKLEVRAILMGRVPPPDPPRPPRLPRRKDEWRCPGDPRYQDAPPPSVTPVCSVQTDDGPEALVSMPVVPQIAVHQVEPQPWDGPNDFHGHRPRKTTPAMMARALELRAAGWSWPAIARELGCHRQTLYFARKRLRQSK